ncbi:MULTISPECIES: transcription elongation factor GreA [unclassified Oceanispirochaeta]|uniref:transcription elongation factor GreA n=1 Tax=unclassified Oceanispirochaeta TaxID=2635722 RepID=UPI000E094743|nr:MULTISPECIES: transcription elongation factor GreA [unclassified Oceanispirochaeta]MBF9016067.1 transcription elongation factor GreA [Oceanispirochaeta sp. M2]NPD72530.1 transcription elongation factor GreA [Oceanispirochaeta sp. M1]RDG31987.1 transcription elongation factor GreA [Oceanispirochaeta sp. M1]
MSEEMINKINDLLNEEKWTRATLSNYTIKNFEELDETVEEILNSNIQDEIKELCEEHLDHSKNSIIGLYISGIISLDKQQIDDSHLVELINIFSGNHKWNIVEFLCERILRFGENKMALRVLSECYSNEDRHDEIFTVWERLIKIDYNEAEIVKKLAEKYEADGKTEAAISYYKKAIHRYINKNLFTNVKDVWSKLIELSLDDLEFFLMVEKKIAKTMSIEKATVLLEDIYPAIQEKGDWETAINILKLILQYDAKSPWARKEIVNCYRSRFEGHSQLEEYIKLSNLNQSWRNITEAISDFEKHISFDAGNFVHHKTWGVGVIRGIKGDEITIDFATKRGHTMSLKMAVNALLSLTKNHIWVLKSILPKEKLHAKVKKDIPWTLKTVIRSFNNAADMKRMKAELVPAVLTQGEWSSWSTEARRVLKTDADFGNMPEKLDLFMVRDKPISFEEKTFNRFKAETNFFDRYQTILEFMKEADPDSDYFSEMFNYFTAFLKAANVNEQVVCSFLFVSKIIKDFPFLNPGINYSFTDVFNDVEDLELMFGSIQYADLKREFLLEIKANIDEWQNYYIMLFPYYLNKSVVEDLIGNGFDNLVKDKLQDIMTHFREFREAFLWIAKSAVDEPWFPSIGIPYEKILINMIHLLDITFRDISNKRNVTENKKLNRAIQTFLFKDNRLEDFILSGDEDTVSRLFTLLQDVKEMDVTIKLGIRQKIKDKYPKIKFLGEKEETPVTAVSHTLFVLEESLRSKQKELKHILDVEVPQNSKEIGIAIEMGDLKENAEYKAGKEKQESLNIQVGKLKEGIEKAKVFDPSTLDIKKVSFGTKVTLVDENNEKEEVFTILGPWESDPSNNVISYVSPFGAAIMGIKLNKSTKFTINEKDYSYKITLIEKADLL